jgi:hypothetical protein
MKFRQVAGPLLLACLLAGPAFSQDELPAQGKRGKVCVAIVANSTSTSIFVEHMTDRLTHSLNKNEIEAVTMESATPANGKLEPNVQNGQESKDKDCLYTLLTRVTDPGEHPLEMQGPRITLGGRPNAVDAADPSNAPMNSTDLRIDFALFRTGRFKPVTDAAVLSQRPRGASDAFIDAMDQEANRIAHDINKK